MKEIKDIIFAAEQASAQHMEMALATVVKVEGSSYRRAGARMLVTADGRMTGAISGGCLEGDALKKALLAIQQRQNRLVTYDTSSHEGNAIGLQLGCNGIVHILFEYIDFSKSMHPITLLENVLQHRREAILVTCFSEDRRQLQLGSMLLTDACGSAQSAPSDDAVDPRLSEAIALAKSKRQSVLTSYKLQKMECKALVEYLAPTVHLVVVGAGNDAQPLVETADILGWEITVVDGRATHASEQRFPAAKQIIVTAADHVIPKIQIDPWTVFVLMTHNYQYDLQVLGQLVATNAAYIGSLGPKIKLDRMFKDLEQLGLVLTESDRRRIHGPVGLDIGAENAAEIAIAVLAEIKAVLSGRPGTPLKYLPTKIHAASPLIL